MTFANALERLDSAITSRQPGEQAETCSVRRQDLRELLHHFHRLDDDVRQRAKPPQATGIGFLDRLDAAIDKNVALIISHMSPEMRQRYRDALGVVPQSSRVAVLELAIREACDLLAERTYGSPARSPGHNARLTLERALKEENPAALVSPIWDFQDRVAAAHIALFSDDPTDIDERNARSFEESVETAQAFGMSREDALALVEYTFSRPAGEPKKEIGAKILTAFSLCVLAGIDAVEAAEADLEKLQKPETIARIRAKRATRHGRGALPGFDPKG